MTIPNLITILRILLVPVFVTVSLFDGPEKFKILFAILFFSGITDVVDGVIARKFNMKSKVGAVLDPVADKLMQVAVFVCLAIDRIIPFWLVVITFLKDIFMVIGASILLKTKTVISSDFSGKFATVIFYLTSLVFILAKPPRIIKNTMLLVIILSAFCAFVNYSMIFYKIIVKENDRNVQTYKH